MATPREELEELRALDAQQTPRQELEELRQLEAQQTPEVLPEGTALDVVLEPIQAIGSSILGSAIGGVGGAITAPFAGTEKAEDVITGVQEFAAEVGAPETQRGQAALQTVGDLMQKGMDIANFPISGLAGLADLLSGQSAEQAGETIKSVQEVGLSKTAGNQTLEATGDPLLATMAEMTPAIITSLIPVSKIASKNMALRQKIADKIKSGSTDKELATLMVADPIAAKAVESVAKITGQAKKQPVMQLIENIKAGSSRVKGDPLAKETIKQGFDQSVIAAVKGSSKVDKAKMSDMVDIMKKGKDNAKFAMKNRPSDVAGNSLVERVNFVKKINKEAGKQVDDAAKALKGQQVNFDKPIDNFMGALDEMGVRIGKNLRPIFKGSDIEGLSGPETAINNIIKRLSSGKRGAAPDAHELHRMKRYIDEIVTYGKEGEGLKGKTERILKSLRRDLDDTLDSNFPDYNAANTKYADTVGALDSLQDVAGKKMDLFGPNADKATGTLLRRMMSNAQSRVNLVDSVDSLESIAKKYGGEFGDDISSQMLFVDELDNVFGSVARTSLAGEAAKGIQKARKSIKDIAIDTGAAGIEKLRRINEDNAFKSITELLKRDSQ